MEKKYGRDNKEQVYELAICFSRMWGIAETFEELPNIGFNEIKDKMIDWAVKCIDSGEKDFIKFFQEKIKEEKKTGCGNSMEKCID